MLPRNSTNVSESILMSECYGLDRHSTIVPVPRHSTIVPGSVSFYEDRDLARHSTIVSFSMYVYGYCLLPGHPTIVPHSIILLTFQHTIQAGDFY